MNCELTSEIFKDSLFIRQFGQMLKSLIMQDYFI